jgi:hypothetical protein
MRNLYAELRRLLRGELSGPNLDKASTLAVEASYQATEPLALFVIVRVIEAIENRWNSQGFLLPAEFALIEDTVLPPVDRFLSDASAHDLDPQDEQRHLNEIVVAFLRWRAGRDD